MRAQYRSHLFRSFVDLSSLSAVRRSMVHVDLSTTASVMARFPTVVSAGYGFGHRGHGELLSLRLAIQHVLMSQDSRFADDVLFAAYAYRVCFCDVLRETTKWLFFATSCMNNAESIAASSDPFSAEEYGIAAAKTVATLVPGTKEHADATVSIFRGSILTLGAPLLAIHIFPSTVVDLLDFTAPFGVPFTARQQAENMMRMIPFIISTLLSPLPSLNSGATRIGIFGRVAHHAAFIVESADGSLVCVIYLWLADGPPESVGAILPDLLAFWNAIVVPSDKVGDGPCFGVSKALDGRLPLPHIVQLLSWDSFTAVQSIYALFAKPCHVIPPLATSVLQNGVSLLNEPTLLTALSQALSCRRPSPALAFTHIMGWPTFNSSLAVRPLPLYELARFIFQSDNWPFLYDDRYVLFICVQL